MNATNTKKHTACPECGGETILYTHPHEFAGIWECQNTNCGASDLCEHENTHTESVEVTSFVTPDIDNSYNTDVEVCDLCGVTVEQ